MGQLLSSTAVWLVKFPVKPCEFRSSLWAGVVLICGASEGMGCERVLLSDGVCSTEGMRRGLANLGSPFPSQGFAQGWAAVLESSEVQPSHHWSSSSDSWLMDECKSLFSMLKGTLHSD